MTDACSVITYAVLSYNQTIHSVTGLTPFEVVFGHTESNPPFDVEFNKEFMQNLMKDHVKRTKYLYKYLTDKMLVTKEKRLEKETGEKDFNLAEDDTIFIKGVNTRRSKDKPKYSKAKIIGDVVRNTVPIRIRERDTQVHIKDIKRPPQVRPPDTHASSPQPGPSTRED